MMIQKYKVGPGRSRVFFLRFETTRTIITVAIVGTKNGGRATILAWSAQLG